MKLNENYFRQTTTGKHTAVMNKRKFYNFQVLHFAFKLHLRILALFLLNWWFVQHIPARFRIVWQLHSARLTCVQYSPKENKINHWTDNLFKNVKNFSTSTFFSPFDVRMRKRKNVNVVQNANAMRKQTKKNASHRMKVIWKNWNMIDWSHFFAIASHYQPYWRDEHGELFNVETTWGVLFFIFILIFISLL